MWRKRISISIALTVIVSIILGFSTINVSANGGLTFNYLVSYSNSTSSPPHVTITISNLNTKQIDLVISPMNIFTGQDQSLWLIDFQQISATGEQGQQLSITNMGLTDEHYLGKAAQYRLIRINVAGQSTVTIQYVLNRPIWTGFLETLLLRPRDHNLVGDATLRFELPAGWQAVTVLTKKQNVIFPLGSMDSFYGDNQDSLYNFVPAGFAVGEQKDIVEVETNCGRLIYSYPLSPMNADSVEARLGKAFFDYYCTKVGPLAPFNAFIDMAGREWWDIGGQPGLYPFYGQHNRTIDLSMSTPFIEYRPWEWKLNDNQPFISDTPNFAYYGFPHQLIRAWFSAGGLLSLPLGSDWFFRGGISHYFQEMAMSIAFGEHKAYQRFHDLYQYYQTNYVQTGFDQSLFSQPANEKTSHFISYFKSGLWAFYLNQRILEATQGEKSLADLSRYLYANYAGIGRPLTYEEIKQAVNVVAGTDLSDVWTRYAYGNKPLPLDVYFQDNDQDGLMNGLEAELRTNPNSADSNGNGITDSVEYAMECEQYAEINNYCTEIVPAEARHELTTATPLFSSQPISTELPTVTSIPEGTKTDLPEMSPVESSPASVTWIALILGSIVLLITGIFIFIKKKR